MSSVIDDRIHWSCWGEWANYVVKDAAFRLRTLEAERFFEGERGRLSLSQMTALDDAIRRVNAVAHLMSAAAASFDEIASSLPRAAQEEKTARDG